MKTLIGTMTLLAVVCGAIQTAEAQQLDEYTGTVAAARQAEAAPSIDALLERVDFTPGQIVKKGDLLFEFSSKRKELSLAVAKARQSFMEAQLRLAEVRLKNAENLRARDISSEIELLQAQAERGLAAANVAEAQANVGLAEFDSSDTRLFAPIDGVISAQFLKQGAYITPEFRVQSLATIVQLDPIEVVAEIPYETFLERQKMFDGRAEAVEKPEFKLTLPNGDTYTQSGRLVAGTGTFNPASQVMAIAIEFPNPDFLLRPGLKVTLRSSVRSN